MGAIIADVVPSHPKKPGTPHLKDRQHHLLDRQEDEYEEQDAEEKRLEPLRRRLAEWINTTTGVEHVTGENLFESLETGALACRLARSLQEAAQRAVAATAAAAAQTLSVSSRHDAAVQMTTSVPVARSKWWERASRGSFQARDNAHNFLRFCRALGVHENLLFESEDMVGDACSRSRNVLLCLLEVAKLTHKLYGLPGVVEEGAAASASAEDGTPPPPAPPPSSRAPSPPPLPPDELDRRVVTAVQEARCRAENCHHQHHQCNRVTDVHKVGEGRYRVAGRSVLVRLLRGQQLMVRVGGGWDTLDHFLLHRHHEPSTTTRHVHNSNSQVVS